MNPAQAAIPPIVWLKATCHHKASVSLLDLCLPNHLKRELCFCCFMAEALASCTLSYLLHLLSHITDGTGA